MQKVIDRFIKYILIISLTILPVTLLAADFIELTVDPRLSDSSDADQVTLLINRSNITHVEIDLTKTPERAWYKVVFHTDYKALDKDRVNLFVLECSSSDVVKAISNAIRNGDKNPINALESCRLIEQ